MQQPFLDAVNDAPNFSGKILFIEDEELIRELYADALQFAGFDFVLVKNGEDGLEQWQEDVFNLLITDIGLPGISGWDVIESIRKKDEEVPIIVISGWTNNVEHLKGEELNVNYVLSKPIDLTSLIDIIKECLQQSNKNIPSSNQF
jgi:DNA-binding response OmpR family regulator